MTKTMSSENLLNIRSELNDMDIKIWIDGGWGVDALLGKETRAHKDMDFIADKKFYGKIRQFFFSKGYEVSDAEPDEEWHFILEGPEGMVDVMMLGFLEDGSATYAPSASVGAFPDFAFDGVGEIDGTKVECISAKYRLLCLTRAYGVVGRTGYVFNEKDYNDLKAISDKFDIPMPKEFEEAKEKGFPGTS